MNFYNISQVPEREQVANHYHSSLEEPNLENIEAQLYATRKRNKQIAKQYFKNKFGSSHAYQEYLKVNQLEGLDAQDQEQLDYKEQLQKKAREIEQQQFFKITKSKDRQATADGGSEENRRMKHKYNPWMEQDIISKEQQIVSNGQQIKNNKPELLMYIKDERQFGYKSDFKNYLKNKKLTREEQDSQLKHSVGKSQLSPDKTSQLKVLQKSQLKVLQKNQLKVLQDSSAMKVKTTSKQKCYEQELVKKIFHDIKGKFQSRYDKIEKLQLIQFLIANNKILRVLGLDTENVNNKIMNSGKGMDASELTFDDVLIFVLNELGKQSQARQVLAQRQFDSVPSGCMLPVQLVRHFEAVFKSLDQHSDLIIQRIPFINNLATDPVVKQYLNLPAVYEPDLGKQISLRRIFERIQIQSLLGTEESRKLTEYISWNQFARYFESGHKQRGKYDLIVLLQSLKSEKKFGLGELPEPVAHIIQDAFKNLDKGEQFFNTIDVINEIKLHRDYEIEKYTDVRSVNKDTDLPSGTFEDVLQRIKRDALSYVNAKEFLEYFSLRGRPIEEVDIIKSKAYSGVKVTDIGAKIFEEPSETPEGYDSDPEIYNNSKILAVNQSKMLSVKKEKKSQKQTRKMNETADNFPSKYKEDDNTSKLKITVPEPFQFQERERERKKQLARTNLNQSLTYKSIAQNVFKAKPIPKKVAEVGLFDKLNEEQIKKIQERKKFLMLMTLAQEKPFSFQKRKVKKKTKEERHNFIFKANPIPWYCSVNLLNRKKEEEIIRKEKIAKLAQQKLASAKLPSRMEKDFQQREINIALEARSDKRVSKSVMKIKSPPDFQRLHKEFEQALERKRKGNKVTEIKQFNFSQGNKNPKEKPDQTDTDLKLKTQWKKMQVNTQKQIDVFANSTAKFTQQVEKRRQQIQQKRAKEEAQRLEDQQRIKIDSELKKKVQEAAKRQSDTNEAELKRKRKEESEKEERMTKERLQQCIRRGRQQPLLVQRITKRDQKMIKMKRLHTISETLRNNGIKGKEHDSYFKKDQLLLLQDYEVLKHMIDANKS